MKTSASIQHVAGEPDMVKRTQCCSRCGLTLIQSISFPPYEATWKGEVYQTENGMGIRCETEHFTECQP